MIGSEWYIINSVQRLPFARDYCIAKLNDIKHKTQSTRKSDPLSDLDKILVSTFTLALLIAPLSSSENP